MNGNWVHLEVKICLGISENRLQIAVAVRKFPIICFMLYLISGNFLSIVAYFNMGKEISDK